MTDSNARADSQPATASPAEPPILRDVVEPLAPRQSAKGAAQRTAQAPGESKQADQLQRDEQTREFLDKYDLSQVEEERRERRWALRR